MKPRRLVVTSAKIVHRIISERLHHKGAGIRDNRIDQAELLEGEFCKLSARFQIALCRRRSTRDGRKLKAPSILSRSGRSLPRCIRARETPGRFPALNALRRPCYDNCLGLIVHSYSDHESASNR